MTSAIRAVPAVAEVFKEEGRLPVVVLHALQHVGHADAGLLGPDVGESEPGSLQERRTLEAHAPIVPGHGGNPQLGPPDLRVGLSPLPQRGGIPRVPRGAEQYAVDSGTRGLKDRPRAVPDNSMRARGNARSTTNGFDPLYHNPKRTPATRWAMSGVFISSVHMTPFLLNRHPAEYVTSTAPNRRPAEEHLTPIRNAIFDSVAIWL